MEEALKDMLTVTLIKENINMGKLTAKESISGLKVEKFMMENGKEECDVVLEFGVNLGETIISANGKIIKLTVTESTLGLTETDTKGNGRFV